MKFTKIKYDGKKLELVWSTSPSPLLEVTNSIESKLEPVAAFPNAMAAFVPMVITMLKLPPEWLSGLSVTGVSLSEDKDERRGVVLTARRPIEQANQAPLILNTPYLKEPLEAKEENAVGYWPSGMAEAIEAAETAARKFLGGERAQTEMKLEEKSDDPPTPLFADDLKRGRAHIPGQSSASA